MQLLVVGSSLGAQVTAVALASTGHQVCLIVDEIPHYHALEQGRSLWREPGLDSLLQEVQHQGLLTLSSLEAWPSLPSQPYAAVFLALAPNQWSLAESITLRLGQMLPEFLLVNQSTFPVGSTEALQALLPDAQHQATVCLPDLLQEGAALAGWTRPERILLGCKTDWAEERLREILRPFNRRQDHFMVMSPREAEFTKLAITGMLATRLSFMNDMANLADALQVDIEAVRQGVGSDPRIGDQYLYPGCGFGGLSFSRDVMSLATTLEDSGVGSELLEEVLVINERQKEILFRKAWQHFETHLQGKTFAIWGAAFKPGSDRIDNAPVLRLLQALWAQGARVQVHDPKALDALAAWAGERDDLQLCATAAEAVDGADALMLLTEWKTYWSPDFEQLRRQLRTPVIFDGRNIYDPQYLQSIGFTYYGVGRQAGDKTRTTEVWR